jgi:hypothetical protein
MISRAKNILDGVTGVIVSLHAQAWMAAKRSHESHSLLYCFSPHAGMAALAAALSYSYSCSSHDRGTETATTEAGRPALMAMAEARRRR